MPNLTENRARLRDKNREQKRRELAENAITTIAQAGYANTTLRDIASSTGVSLGKIQYYFPEKEGLLLYCIDLSVNRFIGQLNEIVGAKLSPREARGAYVELFAHSIVNYAHLHRLWYDIRNQAMFDSQLKQRVADVEARFVSVCDELGKKFALNDVRGLEIYLMLDGAYRYFIQQSVAGLSVSVDDITHSVERLIGYLTRNQATDA
ncbi:TetR/AcrR family transcriptional regulator [Ruegeria sp. Ofav3-42]|uniref:TetR/AcrR family transcriptional regulator n=1 Tax=Ruegeria sp. Ofav3-42 TaxID=2917759 RepID=UPI001EF43F24|nr:TetR/AcrR family transcriptional regulator [Ruegeria sp. Ofav3-42]MCG7519960.1 TetR/AcrR family transcriptional regulator [Ruegeria sp. Ofav3-42]